MGLWKWVTLLGAQWFICSREPGWRRTLEPWIPHVFYLWAVETVKLGASLSSLCAGRPGDTNWEGPAWRKTGVALAFVCRREGRAVL